MWNEWGLGGLDYLRLDLQFHHVGAADVLV